MIKYKLLFESSAFYLFSVSPDHQIYLTVKKSNYSKQTDSYTGVLPLRRSAIAIEHASTEYSIYQTATITELQPNLRVLYHYHIHRQTNVSTS